MGELSLNEIKTIEQELDILRDKKPTIFNIETTNYCNMTCVMCPRTIYMTRKNIVGHCFAFLRPITEKLALNFRILKPMKFISREKKQENMSF